MRVLIVKTGSLGDIVHALPAVKAFKAARPDSAVDWLVERR
ncbi:MAG: lipopolysaccharide heptosyltransferase I, partial [Deltaproteobacteria bacterium]|nr:lipopolysaccharide heptosyltransferase I [Deltaproteobacteria bacterium]